MQVLSSEMVGGHLSNWLYRPQFSWICWDSGPKAIYVSHCFVSIFSRPWIVIAERRFSNVWLLTNLAKVMSTFFTSQFTSRRKKWARGNEILIQISCQHVLNIPNSSQFWSQLSWQTCFVLGNSRADRTTAEVVHSYNKWAVEIVCCRKVGKDNETSHSEVPQAQNS